MTQIPSPKTYRRVVLVRRPPGEPAEADFRVEDVATPEPGSNQVLVRVIYLSLDPYMRGRMRDAASYAAPVGLGEVMPGGTVGEVVQSNHPGFKPGEIVEDRLGWQEYALSNGTTLRKIDPALAPISTANGVLGMPGMTAWFGLLEIGQPKPGETVVVSAASGAVGQVVGQLAKLAGCRVVGIAGGAAKCAFIKNELGFDAAVDYKAPEFREQLAQACAGGVDIYFDNTAGTISDAVMTHLKVGARVIVCGTASVPSWEPPPQGPRVERHMLVKRARMQGFVIFDHPEHHAPALRDLAGWIRSGKLSYVEDVLDGLDKAPDAIAGLYRGENLGKRLIRL